MCRALFLVLVSMFTSFTIFSQDYSFKYGKVTDDELSMTSYAKDSAASAVYIYQKSDIAYDYRNGDFVVVYNYESKIKILKSEGTSYADVIIPFYSEESSGKLKESISRLEAFAYNLENGKVVKTKLEKNYVFEKQISSKWKQLKFSVPAVKAGTVIEFRYTLFSDFSDRISDLVIQQNIPVIYGNHEVTIPEYFIFNQETRNPLDMKTVQTNEPQSFKVGNSSQEDNMVRCNSKKYIFTVEDLPALKDEPNIWSPGDYKTQVIFELARLEVPGSVYKSFTTNWDKIDEMLKGESEFGGILKMQNPYKNEMDLMNLSSYNNLDKIRILFKLIKSKISWNNQYNFYGGNVKKAIKAGTGSNADINFVFISMLKDAGLNAYPVMMSRRNVGILPFLHPSITKLNTFIVGISDTDSTMVYLDGSVSNGDINIIPPVLMVERGRVFREVGQGSWVDLSEIGTHSVNIVTICKFNKEGNMEGQRKIYYTGQYASNIRNAFMAEKDSATYLEKVQSNDAITITSSTYKGLKDFSSVLEEQLTFTKSATINDDFIYVNPLLFPHLSKNQFIKEERKLPVEFDYPYSFKIRTIINLPEGYEVDELPQSIKVGPEQGGCSCTYVTQRNGNQIVLSYTFIMDKTLFPAEEYAALRQFWTKIVEKNSEIIVLKKVS